MKRRPQHEDVLKHLTVNEAVNEAEDIRCQERRREEHCPEEHWREELALKSVALKSVTRFLSRVA